MSAATGLLIGEFIRTVDRRYRLAIPPELCELLLATGSRLVIAKERSGCLSLWPAAIWQPRIDGAIEIMGSKLQAGLFAQRVGQLQELGRLLSTRHKIVSLKAQQAGGARGLSRIFGRAARHRISGSGRGCLCGTVAAGRLERLYQQRDARVSPPHRCPNSLRTLAMPG